MTRTRCCTLCLIALLLAVVPAASAADLPELNGLYMSKGLNPDGSTYEGVVQIVRHGDGGSFVVTWMFPRAGADAIFLVTTSVGVGIASGGMLAVSYYGKEMAGVVLYQIEENGRVLAGHWTLLGDDGAVYTETLTRVSDQEPPAEPAEGKPRAPRQPRPRSTHVREIILPR